MFGDLDRGFIKRESMRQQRGRESAHRPKIVYLHGRGPGEMNRPGCFCPASLAEATARRNEHYRPGWASGEMGFAGSTRPRAFSVN